MNRKKHIYEFIKTHALTVISTVGSDNVPESAVIRFGQTSHLEIIFSTFTNTRKYKNIMANPSVSFVIGWDERITVQYVGIAEELQGKDKLKYKKLFYAQSSKAIKWDEKKPIAFFKVTPKWIRYSDLNKDPWEIFELKTF